VSVNDNLLHKSIDHAVDLQHYSNGVVYRIIGVLNRTDRALFADLVDSLERLPSDSFTVERLEGLLFSVRQLNRQAYEAVGRELTDDLHDLTVYEGEFQYGLFKHAIPGEVVAQVGIAPIHIEQVYAAAMARPFQGVLLRGVLADLEASRAKRIRETITQGYVANEPTQEIVRKLRGTRSLRYEDGIFNRSRREVEAVVRTAISHTAAFTRDRFYDANAKVIASIEWVSTLDSRTSPMCRIRDGKRYTKDGHRPIGHTIPWGAGPGALHWNCRSTSAPVTKSWKELTGVDAEEFSPSTRAAMDGEVPADTTYAQWLEKQSAARQDEILGPTRGKLFRQGGLELEGFYNNRGTYLSIDELREKNARAFAKAGV
jgi:SPP1 gp7 family putative phage head morphogenesis protein